MLLLNFSKFFRSLLRNIYIQHIDYSEIVIKMTDILLPDIADYVEKDSTKLEQEGLSWLTNRIGANLDIEDPKNKRKLMDIHGEYMDTYDIVKFGEPINHQHGDKAKSWLVGVYVKK